MASFNIRDGIVKGKMDLKSEFHKASILYLFVVVVVAFVVCIVLRTLDLTNLLSSFKI